MTTATLDRIVNGTRYRSSRRIDLARKECGTGVRYVALWICRSVAILVRDSDWQTRTGERTGKYYTVVDCRDRMERDNEITGEEARDLLQRLADIVGDDEADEVLALARRHAPGEPAEARA